jgi:hypothetical protein
MLALSDLVCYTDISINNIYEKITKFGRFDHDVAK